MKLIKFFLKSLLFILLTILTQTGGFIYLLSILIHRKYNSFNPLLSFCTLYTIVTFLLIPYIAPIFGREKVIHSNHIKPASFITILLNRNYVHPELNNLLQNTAESLASSSIHMNYLDANFPFINKFPLLPHLSHNDGKKIDLSFVYETETGEFTDKIKSNSGYGAFTPPKLNEQNQISFCLDAGYFQYDYPKYLTFGSKNENLIFSDKGTRLLIHTILLEPSLGKLFIEPHLKDRLNLTDKKVRYHGCRAVRHDDHIHIQLK